MGSDPQERLRFRHDRLSPRPRVYGKHWESVFDPETKKPINESKTLESERKGIYLAGVIVAGMHTNEIFIENGRFHGRQIADAIAQCQ